MRYFIFLLLLSTTALSQNYQYALEEAKKGSHQDIISPTIPVNFVARNIGSTSATLNWTAASDDIEVVDYRIYNNNILLTASTEGAVTHYKLTGLSASTKYNLTLRAVDAAGNESKNSNNQVFITRDKDEEITRFIIVGASIMYSTFYFTDQMKTTVEKAYPGANVVFHNHASPGETIGSYAHGSIPNIDHTLSLYDNDNSTIKTYVIVSLGGNDRTRRGAYDGLSQSTKKSLSDDLDYILDRIEAKGFTPILNDLAFRNYDNITYNNEEYGVKPYNDHIIKPKILERSPEFSFEDGQSFWQLYPLIYNNYETYLSSDNIHPSGKGYSEMRSAFVNTICKYIFSGIPPSKIGKNGDTTPLQSSNNMYDEDAYLNAYFYPLAGSSATGLQNALDTYGSVRLEAGKYGNNNETLYLRSNNRLYGVPWHTTTPHIIISQGSSGIVIDGINSQQDIEFETGAHIRENQFKNIYNTALKSTGAIIENNLIINLAGGLKIDNTSSGYFRNNTIIRHLMHGGNPGNVLIGNTQTPSYGNLQVWLNNLTPAGYGNYYDTFQDVTIIGLDAEGWNLRGTSNKAMTQMRNMGDVRITDFGGGNGYSPVKTPPFDIEANNLSLINAKINNSDATNNSKVRANTNVFTFNSTSRYDFEAGGFNLNLSKANTASFNSSPLTSTISNLTTLGNMKHFLLGKEKTPIARPNIATIPNPTGNNWARDRIGQIDQAAYIQELINTNNIAELAEGIYYIGSTLKLKGQNQGIRGAGTGKTAIVGLTDDFPLITFSDINTNRRWHISNLTLQGGHTGLRIQTSSAAQMMVTGVAMHDVVFRNQTYGMHLYRFFGMDNNFFENVNFVSCDIGLYQERNPSSNTTQNDIMYLDKNVFYKSQVIDCGIGFSLIAGRPNNLNAWVDCVFDGNGVALDMHYNNFATFVNCDFKNHSGENVIGRSPSLSLYSCNFSNNTTSSIFKTTSLTMEGCTLSDNVPLLGQVGHNSVNAYIQNSTVTGPLGYYTDGVISNSKMKSNSNLSKLLVHIINGTVTTILNDPPTPYPQFLVKY